MTPRRTSRASAGPPGDLDLFGIARDMAAPASEPRTAAPAPAPILEVPEYLDDGYPGETPQSAVAVSTLTQTAKDVIEGAFIPLWVRGEISDFKAHRNGHWYFCLRDSMASIKCVVWKRDQRGIPAAPDDGMQVAALGRLTVYPARGEMQFTVTRLDAEGDGLRRKALEITRARLEADGLLAPGRKRALPRFPRVIALVTSPDGAALHDIIAVFRKRAADVRLVVVPAAVQGENAPAELCRALEQVNRWGGADLVIVGRGGGSREDLSAFNDERVARAVAACHAPTISAVGHEIDMSICDLVADFRAPTPSAAAETSTCSSDELRSELRKYSMRLGSATRSLVRAQSNRLRHLGRDVAAAGAEQIAGRHTSLQSIAGRLHALSPLATLSRGYAVARAADGSTLSSTSDFAENAAFELIVRDGIVPARVDGPPKRTGS